MYTIIYVLLYGQKSVYSGLEDIYYFSPLYARGYEVTWRNLYSGYKTVYPRISPVLSGLAVNFGL